MKKLLTALILLSLSYGIFAQSTTTVEGIYTGNNIYIKNPTSATTGDFGVTKVFVNDIEMNEGLRSTAFSIDLKSLEFEITEPITIRLTHEEDCKPYVINPGSISAASSCEIQDILLTRGGSLQWTTINESGNVPFIIEQYKWNRWVKIGEVKGKGQKEINKYSFMFDMHYGENIIRVKQVDGKVTNASSEVRMNSIREEPIAIKNTIIKSDLEFSEETTYEIWNEYGVLLATDFGNKTDLSELPDGTYYVNHDGTAGTMITKK